MGKILVITNRKGGCGKSFTTASLGFALARQGKKVLCIDTDNQHSLTVSMGVKVPDELPNTIAMVITNIINKKEIDPKAGIMKHPEGVDFMPANNSLTGIALTISPLYGREIILRKYLKMVSPLYDYCLIDTSPTLDILTVNALAAADSAIIPVTPKFLDAKGLELLLRSIADIKEDINPNLDICGILMTMVDKRTNFSKEIISAIEQAYGEQIRIFKDFIPHSIRAVESSATGKSIFKHDPRGKIAVAYESLAQELLQGGA